MRTDTTELVATATLVSAAFPPPADMEEVGQVVQSDGGPSFQNVHVVLAPGEDVRPGEHLGVWHGRRGVTDTLTIVQVDDCVETNPSQTADLAHVRRTLDLGPMLSDEQSSTRIHRTAKCKTLEDLSLGEHGDAAVEGSAPERLCRAGDVVLRLPNALRTAALGCLGDPDEGLHLGSLVNADAPVTLKPEILQMHLGAFGNPGKGKSYLSGVLIEELRCWDIPTIVLDVNGEMVDAVDALGGEVIALPDKTRFGLALDSITGLELASITPQVDLKRQYAELIETAHDALRAERAEERKRGREPTPITIERIRAKIEEFAQSSKTPKPTSGAALARVGRLHESSLIGVAFPFIEALKKSRIVCLDCRRLQLSETRLVAAAAAREIQRHGRLCTRRINENRAEEGDADWLATLFVDEAHNVVPEGQTSVTSNVLRELARMGRHSRTALILASQSPADLDASVLKRIQTRFVFALEQDQLRSIGGVRADLGDELVDALPKLGRGVCAVSGNGDQVRHGFLMRVRERRTPIGGGTPPVFANRTKAPLQGL